MSCVKLFGWITSRSNRTYADAAQRRRLPARALRMVRRWFTDCVVCCPASLWSGKGELGVRGMVLPDSNPGARHGQIAVSTASRLMNRFFHH